MGKKVELIKPETKMVWWNKNQANKWRDQKWTENGMNLKFGIKSVFVKLNLKLNI